MYIYLCFYEKTRSPINKLQKFLHVIANYVQNSILGIVSCKFERATTRTREHDFVVIHFLIDISVILAVNIRTMSDIRLI